MGCQWNRPPSPGLPGSERFLIQISDHTVTKFRPHLLTLLGARNETRPCPDIHTYPARLKGDPPLSERDGRIVMELVMNNRKLRLCRPSLPSWSKLKIVWTMRIYFRQLLQVQDMLFSRSGPLCPYPSMCHGLQFGSHFHKDHALAEGYVARGAAPPLERFRRLYVRPSSSHLQWFEYAQHPPR